MVKCGNCEYTYNKSNQVYSATWRESGSSIVGKGYSKDYNQACRQAINNFCFQRDGKLCAKTPIIDCSNRSTNTKTTSNTDNKSKTDSNSNTSSKSKCDCLAFDFVCEIAKFWNGCLGCPVSKGHHDYDCCGHPLGFEACVIGKGGTKGAQDAIQSTKDAAKNTLDTFAKYLPYAGIGLALIMFIVLVK